MHYSFYPIGMLHVPALPGTPASSASISEILEKVEHETQIYKTCGVDGVILENMHDTPYVHYKAVLPLIHSQRVLLDSHILHQRSWLMIAH